MYVGGCLDCCLVGFRYACGKTKVVSFFLLDCLVGCMWKDCCFFREAHGQLSQGVGGFQISG